MPKKTKETDQYKPWNRKIPKSKPYQTNSKAQRKAYYIVCKGKNTEPAYFKAFPLANVQVTCYGTGNTKIPLVKKVLSILKEDPSLKKREIWIVFDFDVAIDQPQQKAEFNQAIDLALKNNLHVAYSNDCFELWFLLHYQFIDTAITRKEYYEKLSTIWGVNYEKEGKKHSFCQSIYQKLISDPNANQEKAINYAQKLISQQSTLDYANQNPATTVHELVEALNEYL